MNINPKSATNKHWNKWAQFLECENDSFPLLSSNGVNLNIGQQRHHPECCSLSASLSIYPSASVCLCPSQFFCLPQALCFCSPTLCLLYGDLNWSESLFPFLSSALPSGNAALHTLQAAAVRVGWVGAGPTLPAHTLSLPVFVSHALPLPSAVKPLCTVKVQSIVQERIIVQDVTLAFASFVFVVVTFPVLNYIYL